MNRIVLACSLVTLAGCASTHIPLTCMPCEAPCVYPCRADTAVAQAQPVAKPAPAPVAEPAPVPVAPPPVAKAEPPPPAPAVAPTFSPTPGAFTGTQQVTLSSSTPGARIHYTTDGSTPNASSPVYEGPIAVDRPTTIKAVAIAPDAPASDVMTGAFEVAQPPPPAPARVVVTKEKLELKEKVFFESGKATIKPASFALLDEVAGVLGSHDEVKRVRIEGHTDGLGDPALNKKLSQERAEAVRAYLLKKGVDAARLDAAGYGAEKPIAPNTTAKGREENRRVEFKIGM